MFNRTPPKRAGRAGIALAAGLAFIAVPAAAAQASAVNLATVSPFVVLGGQSVTNTNSSVLNGDLGVAPGTSLTGFEFPTVVNGATHDNDAVAGSAQADLTKAYDVAAGQPVAPGDVLTGQNLGNRTLTAGAYRYASSAGLTGTLTLDAQGDPNAQFVFEIGSTLTTASASKVALINGASPCNVFWQVGSSATIDTTTEFVGNLMALTDITLNNGASVTGRVLARNGAITLDHNVLDNAGCGTGPTSTPGDDTAPGGGTAPTTPGGGTAPTTPGGGTAPSAPGNAALASPATPVRALPVSQAIAPQATRNGRATMRRTSRKSCDAGYRATVRGKMIKRVRFSVDDRYVSSTSRSPFSVFVRAAPGKHKVTARVTFKDATAAKTVSLRYRACSFVALHPRQGASRFTG